MLSYQTFLEFQLLKVITFFFSHSSCPEWVGWLAGGLFSLKFLREQADKDSIFSCCYCLCVQ